MEITTDVHECYVRFCTSSLIHLLAKGNGKKEVMKPALPTEKVEKSRALHNRKLIKFTATVEITHMIMCTFDSFRVIAMETRVSIHLVLEFSQNSTFNLFN